MVAVSWDDLTVAPGEFKSRPLYDPDSDALTLFISDEESYRERVDKLLSVYRSFRTKEVVGCHVKSVRKILDTVHAFKLGIESRRIKIGLLLLGLPLTDGDHPVIKGREYREIVQPIIDRAGTEEITVPT